MPTLPTLQELKSMKYRELQKTCKVRPSHWPPTEFMFAKDLGLKANLKSHEMMGMLLEVQSQASSGPTPTSSPPPQPKSSVRLLTTKTESPRLSSVIIHDIPEEMNGQKLHTATATRLETAVPEPLPPAPPVRSRKAKELQRRLGVGRPIAAGGTGARTVTQSTAFERERIRHSRSKQVETTIPEHSELPGTLDTQQITAISSFQDPSSSSRGEATQEKDDETIIKSPDIERVLSEFVKPLQDQIDALRAEVKRLQALETEVKILNAIVKQGNSRQVDDEAQIWETTFGPRKQYLAEPSTPPATSNVQLPSSKIVISAGYTPTFLGKRQTKSFISEPRDVQREDIEKISVDTLNPVKKRLRLSGEGSSDKGKEVDRVENSRDYTSTTPGFVVYNDPQEEEFLPQTNHIPDTSRYNGSRGTRQGFTTSSMNAPENQNPFSYFLPESSTPLFTSAFPYPEPPQSPTPAGFSLSGSLSTPDDRSDVFKTFGLPPPERARPIPSGSSNDAAAFSLHPPPERRPPSVDESRSTFGLMPTFAGLDPKSEKPSVTSKTTMYGTELEGDTRFGDFGVEGVVMGYWNGDLSSFA